jgi:hypothetical protein
MKTLFSFYNFPEKWSEINPRMAFADSEVNLNIQFFTELDVARADVVNSDCLPFQVQAFMVKVAIALSYCAVMAARIGGHLNQANEKMDKLVATKTAQFAPDAKSDAALGRKLAADLEIIELKWQIKDLEVMHEYTNNIFRTLQKDAENWRARYYGGQSERKLTPGVNEPYMGEGPGMSGDGLPPSLGGRQK